MTSELAALLGLTDTDIATYQATPRACCGRPHGSPLNERPCTAGHCVELWCPCGAPDGTSYGPVECPCKHPHHEDGSNMKIFTTNTGEEVRVHSAAACDGEVCPVHNPMDHHMLDWPMTYRRDRGIFERHCEHGVGHPDPSDIAALTHLGVDNGYGVHGCDGCCHEPPQSPETAQ